jgi:hypothetical protein
MTQPDYEVQELAVSALEQLGPSGENWIRGSLWTAVNGGPAVMCMYGAIYCAAGQLHGVPLCDASSHRVVRRLTRRLYRIACEQYPDGWGGKCKPSKSQSMIGQLEAWNDCPGRQFSEVAALLQKAAQ